MLVNSASNIIDFGAFKNTVLEATVYANVIHIVSVGGEESRTFLQCILPFLRFCIFFQSVKKLFDRKRPALRQYRKVEKEFMKMRESMGDGFMYAQFETYHIG